MNKEIILPKDIEDILQTFKQNGYKAYVVGGAIRDFLLNLQPHDFDIATDATNEQIQKIFNKYYIFKLNEKHKTIVLQYNHNNIEITSFENSVFDIHDDLKRRDYTINSLAFSLDDGLIFNENSMHDLENKIIKINKNNENIVLNDPLRILRGIRFAALLNFTIDHQTENIFLKYKDLIKSCSVERIRDEFSKILLCSKPSFYLKKYFEIFTTFIPELLSIKGFKQNNPHHYQDVLNHSLTVLDNTQAKISLRLSALFHDIGKVETYFEDKNGIGHFYNHPFVSERITRVILKRLKYSNEIIDNVSKLIKYHDYQIVNKTSIKKLLNIFNEEDIFDLYDLMKSDKKAQVQIPNNRLTLEEIENLTISIINSNQCFKLKDLAINGKDLIKLGYSGSEIGKILNTILQLVISENLKNNKNDLLAYISKYYPL